MVPWGRQGGIVKGHEVALWVIDKFIIIIVVLVPWVYTYFKTYQSVRIKYIQPIIPWKLYLNKALKEIVAHKNLISYSFWKTRRFGNPILILLPLSSCVGSRDGWLCHKCLIPGVQDLPSLSPHFPANPAMALTWIMQRACSIPQNL